MPTKTQFEELLAGTTQEWKEVNGVNGLLCTSKTNDNTVFFAAAGFAKDGNVSSVNGVGYSWSISLLDMDVNRAWSLDYNSKGGGTWGVEDHKRYYGFSVHHVCI